jgi:hypothetical protein
VGIVSAWLVARWVARRELRRHAHATQAWGPRVQTGMRCAECGDPLVLSVDWPGIDPVYWEDHLGGTCSNCYDRATQARGHGRADGHAPWPAPDATQARGHGRADGHAPWPAPDATQARGHGRADGPHGPRREETA